MLLDHTTFEEGHSAPWGVSWSTLMRMPPDWPATLAEFVAHAARDETLRQAYVRIRERFLVAIADVIEALCEKHGLTLLVPPLEARRLDPRRGLAGTGSQCSSARSSDWG